MEEREEQYGDIKTLEMVGKAQSNVAATGVKNVTIKRGIFEELPVDDDGPTLSYPTAQSI